MLVLYALLPIILVVILMGVYSWPAKRIMPIAVVLAVMIASFIWKMPANWIIASSIQGTLSALEIIWIVFGALLLFYVMKETKLLNTIINDFKNITPDSRIQVLLIGWLFMCFLESVAGFGTPAAITAPLLFSLGIPAIAAVSITLVLDAVPVAFGAAGTPIMLGIKNAIPNITTQQLNLVGIYSALLHSSIAIFLPLIMLGFMTRFFAKEKSWRIGFKAWKFALVASLSFVIPYVSLAYLIGPELPSVLGSLIGLVLCIYFVKKGWFLPKETWSFNKNIVVKNKSINLKQNIKAWLPYLLVSIILLLTRLNIFRLKEFLNSFLIRYDYISGTSINYSFPMLYSPGTIFVLVALFTLIFSGKILKSLATFKIVIKKIVPATITLIFTVILVKILVNSGNNAANYDSMLLMPAESLASITGLFWFFFSPFIGVLGAFISGSNTVSNLLFGFLQYGIAEKLGVLPLFALALQVVGGGIGNMICIHNIVAACTTVDLHGQDSKVFRINLIPALIYASIIGLVGLFFVILFA